MDYLMFYSLCHIRDLDTCDVPTNDDIIVV